MNKLQKLLTTWARASAELEDIANALDSNTRDLRAAAIKCREARNRYFDCLHAPDTYATTNPKERRG